MDDINEFTKSRETKEGNKYELMNNNSWMIEAKNHKKWTGKEERYIKTQQQTHQIDVQKRQLIVFCLGTSHTDLGKCKRLA